MRGVDRAPRGRGARLDGRGSLRGAGAGRRPPRRAATGQARRDQGARPGTNSLRNEQQQAAEAEAELSARTRDRRRPPQADQALIEAAGRMRAVEGDDGGRGAPHALDDRSRHPQIAGWAARGDRRSAGGAAAHGPPAAAGAVRRPEDALESVRAAMTLGAVLPEMRERPRRWPGPFRSGASAGSSRPSATARRSSRVARDEQTAWTRWSRSARSGRPRSSRRSSRAPAGAELAQQADNLKDLIGKLEQGPRPQGAPPARPRRAKSRPPTRRARSGRLAPVIAFARAGHVPMPVNGVRSRSSGPPTAPAAPKRDFDRDSRRRPGHRAGRRLGRLCGPSDPTVNS